MSHKREPRALSPVSRPAPIKVLYMCAWPPAAAAMAASMKVAYTFLRCCLTGGSLSGVMTGVRGVPGVLAVNGVLYLPSCTYLVVVYGRGVMEC